MGCVTSRPRSALSVQPIQVEALPVSKTTPASAKSLDKPTLPSIQPAPNPTAPGASPTDPPVAMPQPTSFEIPIEDTIRIRARKPQSATPRPRPNPKKLAPVHSSNEELLRKLKDAEAAWNATMDKEKELDPAYLSTLMEVKNMRVAENRAREIEEKKARLAQHGTHSKMVQKRKRQIASEAKLQDTAIHLAWSKEGVCVP